MGVFPLGPQMRALTMMRSLVGSNRVTFTAEEANENVLGWGR